MGSRDERIAPTGHYTAYVWKRKAFPFGELFATPEGALLFTAYRALVESWLPRAADTPLLEDMLEYRHLLLDRELLELRPSRVIEIGAGLSRRGLTFAVVHEIPYLEIDLPPMIAAKRKRLGAAPSAVRKGADDRLRLVAHDVLDPGFGDYLAKELEGCDRAVVLAEGVLGYFPMAERARIAASVARGLAAASTGHFLFDLRDKARARHAGLTVRSLKWASRLVTRGRGLREELEDDAAVRRFFEAAGFRDVREVGPAPHHLAHLSMPNRVWCARAAPDAERLGAA